MSKVEICALFLILWCAFVFTYGTSSGVNINWGAACATDGTLQDENQRNLKGVTPFDSAGCGHHVYDLVYLVWDVDIDGIEGFDCERQLDGDSIIDSCFIGYGTFCNTPPCSAGGFSKNFTWTVDGTYDSLYVIALNDTTRDWATYYGTSEQHWPEIWVVHKDSVNKTINCTEANSWYTNTQFHGAAEFNGTSIASNTEPGAKKVGMERIAAKVDLGTAVWTSIRVDNGPSGGCTNDSTDIDSVKIYKEITGSGFNPDDDSLIGEAEWGPGPPDGGKATVTFFNPETLTTDSSFYYIAFDISSGADRSHCVTACVQDSTYMGIDAPDCRDGNFPFCSSDAGLPVEISRFEAFPGDRLIILEWTTQAEIDNKGFYIYRAISLDGDFSRVNEELIPGAGNSYMPIDYEYTDEGLNNGTTYFYKLLSVTYGNQLSTYENVVSAVPAKERWRSAAQTGLYGCSPNPFVGSTQISYRLAAGGTSKVSLQVYDISGRVIRTLVDAQLQPGDHLISWDGLDENGRATPSGLYFCRLKGGNTRSIMKLVRVN